MSEEGEDDLFDDVVMNPYEDGVEEGEEEYDDYDEEGEDEVQRYI